AVLKSIRYVEHDKLTEKTEVVETGEVEVFVGADYIVTVRHGQACPLDGVRARLERDPELLALGPASVLYAVADHIVDDYEEVGGADELLSSILNANLTQLTLQQNDDMRKMTAWAGIIAVPTAITGFFGQNVPYPGFDKHSGFWVSTLVIAAGMGYLYWLFK